MWSFQRFQLNPNSAKKNCKKNSFSKGFPGAIHIKTCQREPKRLVTYVFKGQANDKEMFSLILPRYLWLWEGWCYQIGWIFGKISNGLWPPFIFGKLCCNFFLMDVAFMQGGMRTRWNACTWFPERCVLFWFFLIQLLKKHTLNPEITLLN